MHCKVYYARWLYNLAKFVMYLHCMCTTFSVFVFRHTFYKVKKGWEGFRKYNRFFYHIVYPSELWTVRCCLSLFKHLFFRRSWYFVCEVSVLSKFKKINNMLSFLWIFNLCICTYVSKALWKPNIICIENCLNRTTFWT